MNLILTEASTGIQPTIRPGDTRLGRVVVYADLVGETIMEQFALGRRNRPYNEWKPLVQEFLESILGRKDLKLRWSQTAGCSCPCSPGFIVKRVCRDGSVENLKPRHIAEALEPARGRYQAYSDNRTFNYKWFGGYDLNVYLSIADDQYLEANRAVVKAASEGPQHELGEPGGLLNQMMN